MLRAERLAAQRGGVILFANVEFALGPGEALIVTGANGTGKTTLLRIVAGLTQPHEGRAFLGQGADYGHSTTRCVRQRSTSATPPPSRTNSPPRKTCFHWPRCTAPARAGTRCAAPSTNGRSAATPTFQHECFHRDNGDASRSRVISLAAPPPLGARRAGDGARRIRSRDTRKAHRRAPRSAGHRRDRDASDALRSRQASNAGCVSDAAE